MYRAGFLGQPAGGFSGVTDVQGLGALAVSVMEKKLSLPFAAAFIRGIFCNMLVILAVIMSAMARDVTGKMLACMAPVMAFVAIGFEHCVANMFLIPAGLLVAGVPLSGFGVVFDNIIPVTLGNIAGGIIILFIHPNRIRQIGILIKSRSHKQGAGK